MQLQWKNEKAVIESMREIKQKIEDLKIKETHFEREGNLSKAAEIKHGLLPDALAELEAKSRELENIQSDSTPASGSCR